MNNNRTTIAISKQTLKKLHNLQHKLEKIVGKKLSPEKVIRILLCIKPLEEQLVDLIAEAEAMDG